MRTSVAIVASVLALSGCLQEPTPADIAAARERTVIDHRNRCQNDYGAKLGTQAFTQCMLSLDQMDQQALAQRRAAALAYFAATRANTQIPTPSYGPRPYVAPSNNIYCTSNQVGSQVYTNCH